MLKVCCSVFSVANGLSKGPLAKGSKGPFPFRHGTLLLAPLIQAACISAAFGCSFWLLTCLFVCLRMFCMEKNGELPL